MTAISPRIQRTEVEPLRQLDQLGLVGPDSNHLSRNEAMTALSQPCAAGREMFMAQRTRRVFTHEYQAEAVQLARPRDGDIAATARDLGIDVTTLRDWLRRASTEEPEA